MPAASQYKPIIVVYGNRHMKTHGMNRHGANEGQDGRLCNIPSPQNLFNSEICLNFKKYLNFIYVSVCVCAHICVSPMESRKVCQTHGARLTHSVTGSCEVPNVGAKNLTQVLWESNTCS